MMMTEVIKIIKKRDTLKLWEVSKKIGIPTQTIINILLDAGFAPLSNYSNTTLSAKQMDFVANAYVNAVLGYQKRMNTEYSKFAFLNFDRQKIETIENFISLFITNKKKLSTQEILESNLNSDLILNFFYDVVYTKTSKDTRYFYSIHENLKLRVINVKKDNIPDTLSLKIINHNHIYPNEEDEHIEIAENLCFSYMFNNPGEAIIKLQNYIPQKKWKIEKYLLTA